LRDRAWPRNGRFRIVRFPREDLRMNARAAVVALVSSLSFAGCGGGDEKAAMTKSTTATEPPAATQPTTATQPSEGIDPMVGASTRPVVVRAANKATALLTHVRAARHEGYDRIVFEFANALGGYDVRYVQPPVRQDGSGAAVRVNGTALLRIRMENALDADLTKPSAPRTYTGPQRFDPGTPEIAELVRTGGFEAVLTWVAGLRDRVDFRVSALRSPPRIVVDVRNH
jgi:hypothetical protein